MNYCYRESHSNVRWNIKGVWQQKYYAVNKIWNDRERAQINTIQKEVIKTPIFKYITEDRLQDRNDNSLKNRTLLNKPNREKDFLPINKINDPNINISSLSTHSPPSASPVTPWPSIQTQTQRIPLSLATPQFNPNSPSQLNSSPSNISVDTPTTPIVDTPIVISTI